MYLFVTPPNPRLHPGYDVDYGEKGFLSLYVLQRSLCFSRNLLFLLRFNYMVGAVGFEPTTDRL